MAKRIGPGIHECSWDFLRSAVCAANPQVLSVKIFMQTENRLRRLLLLSAGGAEEETRWRKGAAPKSGWLGGASAWPVFGAAQRASLPRSEHSRAAGRGRLAGSSSLGRLGEEHTHPFRSQMAKVQLHALR